MFCNSTIDCAVLRTDRQTESECIDIIKCVFAVQLKQIQTRSWCIEIDTSKLELNRRHNKKREKSKVLVSLGVCLILASIINSIHNVQPQRVRKEIMPEKTKRIVNKVTHERREYPLVNGCQVIFQWRKSKLYRAECVIVCLYSCVVYFVRMPAYSYPKHTVVTTITYEWGAKDTKRKEQQTTELCILLLFSFSQRRSDKNSHAQTHSHSHSHSPCHVHCRQLVSVNPWKLQMHWLIVLLRYTYWLAILHVLYA